MRRALIVPLIAGLAACSPAPEPLDEERIAEEVLADLRHFESRLNEGDFDEALSFYADDPRFVAYEDGVQRYEAWSDIAEIYAQLPDFGPGVFRYIDPQVVVTDERHAHLSTGFWTSFGEEGAAGYFQFEGVLTALMVRDASGWQMLVIHSSSLRERGDG